MARKRNPAAGVQPAGGAEIIPLAERRDPRLNQTARQAPDHDETVVQRRWLHVAADGEELWFMHEPDDVPTLFVELLQLGNGRHAQQTYTRSIRIVYGAFTDFICPLPRGAGWTLHDNSADSHTVWRRRHRRHSTWHA